MDLSFLKRGWGYNLYAIRGLVVTLAADWLYQFCSGYENICFHYFYFPL